MAVIDELNLSKVKTLEDFNAMPPEIQDAIRQTLGAIFWFWFEFHRDHKIMTVHFFWFVKKDVYVRDLEGLFTFLFGPEPKTLIMKPGAST